MALSPISIWRPPGPQLRALTCPSPSATCRQMVTAFRQRYADTYGAEPLGPYDAQSYDSVMLIANAIEKRVAEVNASGNLVINRNPLIRRPSEPRRI